MRLLERDDHGRFILTKDLRNNIPPYAILSHTWGPDEDEISFADLFDERYRTKTGFAKLKFCAQQAENDGLRYFWIDTCCIDKNNHSELSEAITSMFRWYAESKKCYVYLSDVSALKRGRESSEQRQWEARFKESRWFTRGWTLQELIAPKNVIFFSLEGKRLGDKYILSSLVQEITGIPVTALLGCRVSDFTYLERSQWASRRQTTVFEDKVYCLLGIFQVSMPIIYGEREKALSRLKDEIHKDSRSQLDELDHLFLIRNSNVVDKLATLHRPTEIANLHCGNESTSVSVEDKRDHLLKSLSFDQMEARRSTIKRAYSTTCAWLLKHPFYSEWKDAKRAAEHHGFLWINGKPGAGKSTLMKFAHAKMEKESKGNEMIVSFFFNARGEQLEQTTTGMYRSLLYQIFRKAPDLSHLLDHSLPAWDFAKTSPEWTDDMLREILETVVENLGQRQLRCFIDALDECDEQQVRDMVRHFEELGEQAADHGAKLSICFASRHYPTIDIRMGLQLILEHEQGHEEDLKRYVENHLGSKNDKTTLSLRARVKERANGVFMWAILVTNILNEELRGGRLYAVEKRLEEIPETLSELFRDILRRDNTNMGDMLLCLQWILYARRPLSREEFYFAMVAGNTTDSLTPGEWDQETITEEYMDRLVLSSSKGLAELTKSRQPTVQFIHESVRDFLGKDGGLVEIWPEVGTHAESASHERLKICCRRYLRVDLSAHVDFKRPLPKANSETAKTLRNNISTKFPFLEYANRHVLYHSNEAAKDVPQHDFLSKFTIADWINFNNLFERFEINRYPLDIGLVYILAENGLGQLITTVDGRHAALNTGPGRYRCPIFAALVLGHANAIRALLPDSDETSLRSITSGLGWSKGISIDKYKGPMEWLLETRHNALAEILLKSLEPSSFRHLDTKQALKIAFDTGQDRIANLLLKGGACIHGHDESGCYFGETPLQRASRLGWVDTVKLLIELGADVNTNKHGDYPLKCACSAGHLEIAQQLIDGGAEVNRRGRCDEDALTAASYAGNIEIVRLLLDNGAELIGSYGIHGGALQAAASRGHTHIAKLLIESSSNVNTQHDVYGNALRAACARGHLELVRLFIERGADVNAQDDTYGNALHTACNDGIRGSRDILQIAQLLIDRGADVNAQGGAWGNALQAASHHAALRLVRLLIDRGANVNAQGGYYGSALQAACRNGNLHVAKLLLDSGADVNMQSGKYGNSLQAACTYRHLPIVRLLVDRGVDTNAQGGTSGNALQTVCNNGGRGSLQFAQLLIDGGANVNALSGRFGNALQAARQRGPVELVQLLIDKGADINA